MNINEYKRIEEMMDKMVKNEEKLKRLVSDYNDSNSSNYVIPWEFIEYLRKHRIAIEFY